MLEAVGEKNDSASTKSNQRHVGDRVIRYAGACGDYLP